MPTMPVQSRIEIRLLATLAKYYREKGGIFISKSGIIAHTVLDQVNRLVRDEKVVPFTSVTEALAYLEKAGIGYGSRYMNKATIHALREENKEGITQSVVDEKVLKEVVKRLENENEQS